MAILFALFCTLLNSGPVAIVADFQHCLAVPPCFLPYLGCARGGCFHSVTDCCHSVRVTAFPFIEGILLPSCEGYGCSAVPLA